MSEFVWRFANRADGNDLLTLLGDTDVSFDGYPTDPASWFDWLASLDWIASGNEPQSGSDPTGQWWVGEARVFEIPTARRELETQVDKLSRAEAFLAMTEYLWRFANRRGANQVADVVSILRASVSSAELGNFWEDWVKSVRWVLAGNPVQSGPPLSDDVFNG
ncbi:hypothetical protein QFZ53_003607 [Microbacterium natoriense]|uniref:Uncharacterized protein n=1 Tax=Microbacterium natoriense TaxID=284570 RepID=A0AAW8F4L9_9MICO|nr:hypothetical protein [Microbacterium natoriense]MDQ0649411.1 hypothetical protein [Microbacterium natoriense]